MGLIAGFSSRKRKAEAPLYIGPVIAANENNHENAPMGSKKGKRCKWHCMQQIRKEMENGCHLCNVHFLRMDAILPTIINNIKLLFNFLYFESSLDIS